LCRRPRRADFFETKGADYLGPGQIVSAAFAAFEGRSGTMQHDSKVGITPLLHLDKLVQCTADERGRLRIVLPIGENGVAQKLVDHAAGGFDRIPAQPQPSANPQAEGVGVQLPAHGGVAFDIHHEQPANRLSPHDHGRRRFCCDERRRRLSFQAEDEGFESPRIGGPSKQRRLYTPFGVSDINRRAWSN
jgi:hypothetical protein